MGLVIACSRALSHDSSQMKVMHDVIPNNTIVCVLFDLSISKFSIICLCTNCQCNLSGTKKKSRNERMIFFYVHIDEECASRRYFGLASWNRIDCLFTQMKLHITTRLPVKRNYLHCVSKFNTRWSWVLSEFQIYFIISSCKS